MLYLSDQQQVYQSTGSSFTSVQLLCQRYLGLQKHKQSLILDYSNSELLSRLKRTCLKVE